MATHFGNEGALYSGANAVAEIRSFEVNETAGTADTTSMGDTAETHVSALTSWEGSCSAHWDESDTNGQETFTIGASVSVTFAPEGNGTSGDISYVGTCTITGRTVRSSHDSVVEASFTMKGNGALVRTATA